jgi:short-subunit dehydrogenase
MSKTALVTGASSGIGAEFARQLAARGFDLTLVARRAERLAALAHELSQRHGTRADYIAADLTADESIRRIEDHIAGLPQLDLLVNNAGFGLTGAFAAADLNAQLTMLTLHMITPARLMRAALPGMIAHQTGGVINVASLAALFPLPGNANYSATKAYLLRFSQAVAMEVRGQGVKVQALCPGFTLTEYHDATDRVGRGARDLPRFLWGSAEAVVRASLIALDRGQVVCIPGAINRLGALLAATGIPNAVMPLVLRRIERSRT